MILKIQNDLFKTLTILLVVTQIFLAQGNGKISTKSVSNRGRITSVSGSPNRTLYSITKGLPLSFIIRGKQIRDN